ncbi:MAG: hypothetical protein G3I08_08295 [Ferrovum sp.]|jgi:hypothetical protein|nr:hypothetical protein [Ferrovum sp.]
METSTVLTADSADEFTIWEIPAGMNPASDFGLTQDDGGSLTAQWESSHG